MGTDIEGSGTAPTMWRDHIHVSEDEFLYSRVNLPVVFIVNVLLESKRAECRSLGPLERQRVGSRYLTA